MLNVQNQCRDDEKYWTYLSFNKQCYSLLRKMTNAYGVNFKGWDKNWLHVEGINETCHENAVLQSLGDTCVWQIEELYNQKITVEVTAWDSLEQNGHGCPSVQHLSCQKFNYFKVIIIGLMSWQNKMSQFWSEIWYKLTSFNSNCVLAMVALCSLSCQHHSDSCCLLIYSNI